MAIKTSNVINSNTTASSTCSGGGGGGGTGCNDLICLPPTLANAVAAGNNLKVTIVNNLNVPIRYRFYDSAPADLCVAGDIVNAVDTATINRARITTPDGIFFTSPSCPGMPDYKLTFCRYQRRDIDISGEPPAPQNSVLLEEDLIAPQNPSDVEWQLSTGLWSDYCTVITINPV